MIWTTRTRAVLKQPSWLTIALLVSGLPILGFTVLLIVLGIFGIPGKTIPDVYTSWFLALPQLFFWPLLGFAIFKRARRKRKETAAKVKERAKYCPICNLAIPHSNASELRERKRLHVENTHPEFFRFVNRIRHYNSIVFVCETFVLVVGFSLLLLRNNLVALLVFPITVALPYLYRIVVNRRVRTYREKWNAKIHQTYTI
jgi:hypothetical protein